MHCPSPVIDKAVLPPPDEGDTQLSVEFYLSFLLDGVDKYSEENIMENLPEYSKIDIFIKPPDVAEWGEEILEYTRGQSIEIHVSVSEHVKIVFKYSLISISCS